MLYNYPRTRGGGMQLCKLLRRCFSEIIRNNTLPKVNTHEGIVSNLPHLRLTWPTGQNTAAEKHARPTLIIATSTAKQG